MDLEGNLRRYLGDRDRSGRYASFDYCFNYFQEFRATGKTHALAESTQIQTSCLHLGFYLASWGMFRGSAEVSRRSLACFIPVIECIAGLPDEIWEIDCHRYTEETLDVVLGVNHALGEVLPGGHSDTLTTKTMLGVFGCVPALDTYVKRGLGVSTFGLKSLRLVRDFYRENAEIIDRHRVQTLDFGSGSLTPRRYSRAKVIDMILFIQGQLRS